MALGYLVEDGGGGGTVVGTFNALIPKMSSATTPSGNAFASSTLSTSYPWLAFDRIIDSAGHFYHSNTGLPQSCGYQFTEKHQVAHGLVCFGGSATSVTFKLQGSNDGTNYTDLTSAITAPVNELFDFNVTNVGSYSYYRIMLTESAGYNYLVIRELQLYGE